MRLPFFSKRVKSILKDENKRIYLLSQEEQEKLLNNPKINKELVLQNILKENAELKVLVEKLDADLAKDLRAGGTYVLEIAPHAVNFVTNVSMLQDSQLEYNGKKIDIDEPARVGRIKSLGRTRQFRVYFVEPEGEYTYDPSDKTPMEIKKRSEEIIKIKNEVTKASFVQNILKGLSALKKWYDYIPYIMWGVTILGIVIVIFWWLSGYGSLLKAPTSPGFKLFFLK